jgi:hypothetical protein
MVQAATSASAGEAVSVGGLPHEGSVLLGAIKEPP